MCEPSGADCADWRVVRVLASSSSQAFELFETQELDDGEKLVDERALRKLLQDPQKGDPLDDEEMAAFLADLASHGLEMRHNEKVSLRALRKHPCYQADDSVGLAEARRNAVMR